MTHLELIAHLDELEKKATQGVWQQYPDGSDIGMRERSGIVSQNKWEWGRPPKHYVAVSSEDNGAMDLNDSAYIVSLHNAYPQLRRLALAGIKIEEELRNMPEIGNDRTGTELLNWRDSILVRYHFAIKD